MSENNINEALKNIIEKELKKISNFLPKDTINILEKRLSPKIEELIEKSGYVKKEKYKILEKVIEDLEQRFEKIEKDQS